MTDSDDPGYPLREIEAAGMLLAKMGISPIDLLRTSAASSGVPPFTDYIPRVSDAVSAGTRRVYGTYWNRVIRAWVPRPITSVTPLEISQLAEQVKASVVDEVGLLSFGLGHPDGVDLVRVLPRISEPVSIRPAAAEVTALLAGLCRRGGTDPDPCTGDLRLD